MAHENDEQDVPFLVGIGVFSAAFFLAFAIAIVGLFRWWDLDQRENKIVARTGAEVRTLKADQAASLGSYRLLDRETDRVSIPIDRAMDLILEEYAAKKEENSE
tara:strand:- start:146 stop:457 length:312 start_codon:yes stop_codon:yes gene_type:complete